MRKLLDRIQLVIENNELKSENKELKSENLAVNKVNQELYKESQRNKFNKQETINTYNNSVRELLNLQEINNLGLDEKEKNKHRNVIINKLIENYMDKINELSTTFDENR